MTLQITIPGWGECAIEHLVLDYNGTIAVDGKVLPGVAERLRRLSGSVTIHVVTADTFGVARQSLEGLPCRLTILPAGNQSAAKRDYVGKIGADCTAAIGNGRNDRLMLEAVKLGIAVIQQEGASAETLAAADVVIRDIVDALDLLLEPKRLVATLRH